MPRSDCERKSWVIARGTACFLVGMKESDAEPMSGKQRASLCSPPQGPLPLLPPSPFFASSFHNALSTLLPPAAATNNVQPTVYTFYFFFFFSSSFFLLLSFVFFLSSSSGFVPLSTAYHRISRRGDGRKRARLERSRACALGRFGGKRRADDPSWLFARPGGGGGEGRGKKCVGGARWRVLAHTRGERG